MTKRKIDPEILLKKALEEVKKELGVATKTPPNKMKEFEARLSRLEPNFLYRIKDLWKTLLVLMTAFFSIGFVIARLTLPVEVAIKTADNQNSIPSDMFTSIVESDYDFQNAGIKKKYLTKEQFDLLDNNQDGKLSFSEAVEFINSRGGIK